MTDPCKINNIQIVHKVIDHTNREELRPRKSLKRTNKKERIEWITTTE